MRSTTSRGSYQSLPVPGFVGLGGEELELHPAEGHTADGTAVFARWAGVLCVGDYLSDVEIPIVHDPDEYRATLARLAPLVEAADTIVPGHGSPHDRDTALRLLDEDLAYLDGFGKLPAGRDTKCQRQIHEENLRLASRP
jgi:glyoxylase-like metal-dependent hydrolase (beta-lactamase superfamily II)